MGVNIANINDDLNNLREAKDKVLSSIQAIESRKEQVKDALTIISPAIKLDIEIQELSFDKQIITLRKEYRLLELKYHLKFGNITEAEYIKQANANEKSATEELAIVNKKITDLKEEKHALSVYKHIIKKQERLALKKSKDKAEIRAKRTKAILKLTKTLVVSSIEAAISGVLSRLVHREFTSTNFKIGKLENLVNTTNLIIDNIKTKRDIDFANISRNNCLRVLNNSENKLIKLDKILKVLEVVLLILSILIRIIKIVLNFVVLPGPKALILIKLDKIERILTAVTMIVTIARIVLEILISYFEDLKARIHDIGTVLDNIIVNGAVTDSDLIKLINPNFDRLGLLDTTYKGFRFAIKEEFNPDKHFTVQGHKRRYAVAIDLNNTEVLKSELSFTLDPDVLIEQLEVAIDRQNLKP